MTAQEFEKRLATNVGAYIECTRNVNNVSLEEMAKIMDITQTELKEIENGENTDIDIMVLAKFSTHFEISLNLMMKLCGREYDQLDENDKTTAEETYNVLVNMNAHTAVFGLAIRMHELKCRTIFTAKEKIEMFKMLVDLDKQGML